MVIKITTKVTPSNKTETLPGKLPIDVAQGPSDLIPFIDKITIVVPILANNASGIYENIWAHVDDTDVFQDAGSKAKSGGFKFAKRISLPATTARPLFQLSYADKKAQKVRLDFNPRKVTPEGVTQLQSILTSLLPDGWDYIKDHGHLTRLDVAVDIPATRPGMFAFLPQQGLTTKSWSVNGKLQTATLGKKKGNQTLIYNKKEQRLAQGNPWPGPATVRVERRLRNPSLGKLSGLPALANPFNVIQLAKIMPAPPPGVKPWIWELFRDAVSVRGLPAALAVLPKELRTTYRGYLKQHPHPSWDVDAIWKHWPEVLQQSELLYSASFK